MGVGRWNSDAGSKVGIKIDGFNAVIDRLVSRWEVAWDSDGNTLSEHTEDWDEWKDPGEYRVQFDASGLASGMYICRFTAGPVNRTTKMVIVR